jgi:error-prone DNA polymerase
MSWQEQLRALYQERRLMGLTVSGNPLAVLRPWLKQRGFVSAAGLRSLPGGAAVRLAGEVAIVHTPPQRDKQRVIFITIEDETGLVDLALFPRDQADNTRLVLAHPLILVRGLLSRRGKRDALVVVQRVAPPPIHLPGRARAAPRGE